MAPLREPKPKTVAWLNHGLTKTPLMTTVAA
jgi:hypothetical protein